MICGECKQKKYQIKMLIMNMNYIGGEIGVKETETSAPLSLYRYEPNSVIHF